MENNNKTADRRCYGLHKQVASSFHKAASPAFQSMGRDERPMCCGMRCFRTAPGAPEAKNDWSFSTRVQGFQVVQRLAPCASYRTTLIYHSWSSRMFVP